MASSPLLLFASVRPPFCCLQNNTKGVRYCLEELHLVVEPAGAAGISALLSGKVEIKGGPVCAVVSGSNLDKKYFKEALGL